MALLKATLLVIIPVILLALRFCFHQWRQNRHLTKYHWLGTEGKIFFPRTRARTCVVNNFKAMILDGYQKFSRAGQTFILPTLADNLIILPPDSIDWIISQPDSALSGDQPHIDSLQADYTFPHPRVIRSPTHHLVISRDLTRQLGSLTHEIIDEIRDATDSLWPKDETEFKNVQVFSTMMRVVARTSNRVFVGLPHCRNEQYLAGAAGFAREVPTKAALLKQYPFFLKPVAAYFLLAQNRAHIQAFTATIKPEIEKRQASRSDPEKANKTYPNDALQWLINRGEELGGVERNPKIIAGRLMALNFAAIHTSTFNITNTIFDLVSSRPEDRYIEQLREEAETVLAESGGVWTKQGLAKMYKTDSALRESSRLGHFQGPGMIRKVMVKEGLTSPNGTYCPYGSKIAIPTTGIHNDPANYANSATYDPFRFSKQRVASEEMVKQNGDYVKKANLAFVSTSGTYHPFGHGRHCCPGRFFAANELKLLLAHLLLNYDFELLSERPPSFWRGTVYVPPMTSSIRVRRRQR